MGIPVTRRDRIQLSRDQRDCGGENPNTIITDYSATFTTTTSTSSAPARGTTKAAEAGNSACNNNILASFQINAGNLRRNSACITHV